MSITEPYPDDDSGQLSDEQWYRAETLFDAHERIAQDIREKEQSAEGYEQGQRAALNIIETMILEVGRDA